MKKIMVTVLITMLFTFFTSCALTRGVSNAVEKGGQALDGSLFAERVIAHYKLLVVNMESTAIEVKHIQNRRTQEEALLITLGAFPHIELRATIPDRNGLFHLQNIRFLGGNLFGWNEFTLELVGNGVFIRENGSGTLQFDSFIEPVQITQGRIRNRESRISGEQAITTLRNRRERITALTSWMAETDNAPKFASQSAFEAYWKPRLLPEITPRQNRPWEYDDMFAEWTRAEDIRWNRTYTELIFPEELWNFRNSGALLRDWEEALAWIYLEYQWDYMVELLTEQYTLIRIR